MREYANKNIDVVRILTMGDLDVRRMAADNKSLRADKYFAAVEQFVENVPQFIEDLRNPKDSVIDQIMSSLEEIGYDKLTRSLENLKNASGQPSEAAQITVISETLGGLCERLKSAFKRKPSPQDATQSYDTVLLSEALVHFDHLEKHRKRRILAVDDVSVVLHTLNSVLGKHYEVFSLTKASQVKNFLTHTTPELFLLDIEMPDMNGYDLVRVIREHEDHKNTPIIFLTGNASVENLKNAIAIGASDFITKPIDPEILLSKIESKIVWKKSF